MSKMSQLHAELTEQASELGYESIEEAEANGYEIDYDRSMLVDGRELAHEAWIKEKHQVLHLLESIKEDIIDLNGGNNNHVAVDELDYVIDFVEGCHD